MSKAESWVEKVELAGNCDSPIAAANFQRRLLVLKISVLPQNSPTGPKWGIYSTRLCILERNFATKQNFLTG